MNTSEKIASVVAQFIAADREEDRNRIAELERDNNAVVQCCGELRQTIDVYLAEIQRLTEKCAALVVENKRLSEYASGNWVDVPPPSDAGCLYPECGPTCRRDCPPAPADETPAVKQEEQGPWVVQSDGEYLCYDNRGTTRHIEDAYKFDTRAEAQERMCLRERVITLAEARAIEAKRNG